MNATSALRAAIHATRAFRDLSEDDIAFLIEASEIQAFVPGAILMVQGEPSDCAMLIIEGDVTVASDSARGTIPVSTLKAPTLVGDSARSRTCRARRPPVHASVTVLRIGRDALNKVARATPSLLIDIIGRMGDRLARTSMARSASIRMLWPRWSATSSTPRCSRSCAIRSRTWPISGRPSAAWPSRSSCADNGTTKWRAPR